jgi:hypothetical protein
VTIVICDLLFGALNQITKSKKQITAPIGA